MSAFMSETLMIRAAKGQTTERPPIWVMRQAGRYLPEYRELRAKSKSFVDFCLNPEMAAEATLQPMRRFDLDAAIIFADILLIPYAMDCGVHFVKGEGPKMTPLTGADDVAKLDPADMGKRLSAVGESLTRVREALPADKALIGFAGAPWTVATYMAEGAGSKDQWTARVWAWRDPESFDALIDKLAEASIDYLAMQAESGADILKIFDSWASGLPEPLFDRVVIRPAKAIVDGLRARGITQPIIGFPRGAGPLAEKYARETGVDVVAIDQGMPLVWARDHLQNIKPVQGNLDSALLLAGGADMDRSIDEIIETFSGGPHIFNLGHGITPQTPIKHMARLVDRVTGHGR